MRFLLILVAFPFIMGFLLRYFLGNRGFGRPFTVTVALLAGFTWLAVAFVGMKYFANAVAATALLGGALFDAIMVRMHS